MLDRSSLQTLQRLCEADEKLLQCVDDLNRLPSGGTIPKERLKVGEQVRATLLKAQELISEAADLFLIYSGARTSIPHGILCPGANGVAKREPPK
jgi:hypothetical protein